MEDGEEEEEAANISPMMAAQQAPTPPGKPIPNCKAEGMCGLVIQYDVTNPVGSCGAPAHTNSGNRGGWCRWWRRVQAKAFPLLDDANMWLIGIGGAASGKCLSISASSMHHPILR